MILTIGELLGRKELEVIGVTLKLYIAAQHVPPAWGEMAIQRSDDSWPGAGFWTFYKSLHLGCRRQNIFPVNVYTRHFNLSNMAPKIAKRAVNCSGNIANAVASSSGDQEPRVKSTWSAKEVETLVNEFISRKVSVFLQLLCLYSTNISIKRILEHY